LIKLFFSIRATFVPILSPLFWSPWYQWYTLLWNWLNYSSVHVLHLCSSYPHCFDLSDSSGTQH
jgi:hypothetical protein